LVVDDGMAHQEMDSRLGRGLGNDDKWKREGCRDYEYSILRNPNLPQSAGEMKDNNDMRMQLKIDVPLNDIGFL
jgi:hypothetical protein